MTSELKTCPFCGGEPHYKFDDIKAVIGCEDCNLELKVSLQLLSLRIVKDTQERTALRLWNTRAVPNVPELVIVSHEVFYAPTREWRKTNDPDYYRKSDNLVRDLVDKDKAAAVIAAKDAETEFLLSERRKIVAAITSHDEDTEISIADIIECVEELRARAKAAEAKLAQIEKREAEGWFTDDHKTDKSATTYSEEVAERWRLKGWPVHALYTAPVASDADLIQDALPKGHVVLEQSENNGMVHQTVRIDATGVEYIRVVHEDEAYGEDE